MQLIHRLYSFGFVATGDRKNANKKRTTNIMAGGPQRLDSAKGGNEIKRTGKSSTHLGQNGAGGWRSASSETESQVIQLGRRRWEGDAGDDALLRSVEIRLLARDDGRNDNHDRHHHG